MFLGNFKFNGIFLIIIGFVLIFSACSNNEQGLNNYTEYSVIIEIIDSSTGEGVEDATLELEDFNGNIQNADETDEIGVYEFENIKLKDNKKFEVSITKDGYIDENVSLVADSDTITATNNNSIGLISNTYLEGGNIINNFTGHEDEVNSVAISPDGSKVVSGSDDYTAKLWDIESGKILKSLEYHFNVHAVSFSSDGSMIASAGYLSGNYFVKVWDINSEEVITEFTEHDETILSIDFSSDDNMVVSSGYDDTVKVWDSYTGEVIYNFTEHTNNVETVSFSHDDSMIISGSWDNTAKIWDLETGDLITDLTGHKETVTSGEFTSDGSKVVTGSWDGTVKIWDTKTGEVLINFIEHNGYRIRSVKFNSDDNLVISGAMDDTVKVWNAKTGKVIVNFTGHDSSVNSVDVSSGNSKVVSGSFDRTVKVWELKK